MLCEISCGCIDVLPVVCSSKYLTQVFPDPGALVRTVTGRGGSAKRGTEHPLRGETGSGKVVVLVVWSAGFVEEGLRFARVVPRVALSTGTSFPRLL